MKNIAVVFGGYSSEFEVSVKSGRFIYENLKDNDNWNVYEICISNEKNFVRYNDRIYDLDFESFSFKINDKLIKPDAIFNIIHGEPGENGDLAKILENNRIPQTACDMEVSKLTFNKNKYIEFVNNLGVPSSKQILIKKNDIDYLDDLTKSIKYPCIVKPNNGGSSIGLSKVNMKEDLNEKIQIAFQEGEEVLIEDFLDGQEVSVGVIQNKYKRVILPITEIISDNELFDYNAKYLGESKEITPGKVSDKSRKLIYEYLNIIYDNLNLKGITRSEFIIIDEIPYILETNTIPGFTKQSIIPQQIKAQNLKVKDVIIDLVKSII
tara:strand:- start:3797 stop:4765 length:969 start_codon:yes stop_codon:yes gene_type:complete